MNWIAKFDSITFDEFLFTLPDVLKVAPISHRGNVNEIIGKFGGADQLVRICREVFNQSEEV